MIATHDEAKVKMSSKKKEEIFGGFAEDDICQAMDASKNQAINDPNHCITLSSSCSSLLDNRGILDQFQLTDLLASSGETPRAISSLISSARDFSAKIN